MERINLHRPSQTVTSLRRMLRTGFGPVDDAVFVVGIMWILGSSAFAWPLHFITSPNAWITLSPLVPILVAQIVAWCLVVVGLPLILAVEIHSKQRGKMGLWTAVPALLVWALLSVPIVLAGAESLRLAFSLMYLGGSFGARSAILYYEQTPVSQRQLEMAHRRYLEYLRSYIWIATFLGISYLAWELQLIIRTEPLPHQALQVAGLLQLLGTVAVGVVGVVHAFHVRIVGIEAAQEE